MVDAPTTRYAKTSDGVHVAYQVWGDGPVDLLYCGQLWWHLDYQWTEASMVRFRDRLGRIARVIDFDKRGTGLSDRVPVDRLPTLEQRIDDITAVLDAAESSAAVVLGLNHGAPLALLFAATHPARTRSLILHGGFARFVEDDDYPWGFPRALVPRVVAQMEDHWDEPQALRQVAPTYADDPRAQEWWTTMQRMSVSPSAAIALWNMSVETDVRDVLPTVHVPTLVTYIAENRLVDPGCSRHLAEHIAGAKLVEIPGRDLIFCDAAAWVDMWEEFVTGRPPRMETDRALATVMFTDIVDSTKHLSTLGDREWRDVLDRHDALADRALDRFRGRKVNATGDGLLATFDGPARAVQCACAIRDGVAALGIEVRAGVHTGEIELRGNDVSGFAVHLGARVSSVAAANEVLVTRTVTDLVAGSGLAFKDRGEHALKGIEGSWQLYVVESS